MRFDGVRQERLDYFRLLRDDKVITRQEYSTLYQNLVRQQRIANDRQAVRAIERERRQAATEARRVARVAAAEARRAARRVRALVDIRSAPIEDRDEYDLNVMLPMSETLQQAVGQTHLWVQASQNGVIVRSDLVQVKGSTGLAIFWESIAPVILFYEDGIQINVFKDALIDDELEEIRVVVLQGDSIPSEAVQQRFRDGKVHCVIEPLFNLWKKMEMNSESEGSRKRCRQIANRIKSLEAVYPLGVPEDKMEEVAKMSHRCLIMFDIVGNELTRYNKNSSHQFHFTNTRINHIEPGYITIDKQFESVTQDELNAIKDEHEENDLFFHSKKNDRGEIQSLRSAKGAWAVFHEDRELFQEFSKTHGIKNYGIDAVKYPMLNEFVREARLINSAPTPLCDEPNDIDDTNHLDISKAYTQHKFAKYYKGFVGHLQQFCKLPFNTDSAKFLSTHLGIFQFLVVSNPSPLLKKFGLEVGKMYTLPSPEIEYFIHEFGMVVRLIAGAWGSSFDISYTDEMLENRRYAIWAGKLGMDSAYETYSFKGCRQWASNLKATLGDDAVLYFSETETIVIKILKRSYFTTHHILAFITSYTRQNMFEIMRKIDGELVKVVLDGIYFRGEIPDVEIPCKDNKEKIRHIGFRDAWYYPSTVCTKGVAPYDPRFDGSCVLAGAGGTGKSYSVLTNKGVINPLYVVPSHVLGRKCRQAYGCNYTTIHKLIGEGYGKEKCRPYKDVYYSPGVIFIDELTMIEASWIERAIAMYPNALFFIAGDIDSKQWFQCRNGNDGQFSKIWIPQNWRYVYYIDDMRSRDSELRDFKTDLRRVMKEVFTDGGKFDAVKMNLYVKKNYKTVSFDEAASMFQPGDYWIAGTHKTNETLLSRGVVSGYINKDKEIVREDEVGAVKRGSFTTHSFQGLTIDTERVFVSLDFFEYAMLYTSVSRVRSMDQLVIVRV